MRWRGRRPGAKPENGANRGGRPRQIARIRAVRPADVINANSEMRSVCHRLAGVGWTEPSIRRGRLGEQPMVNFALRPISHVAAWLVWHSTHVSLLEDLEAPAPPHEAAQKAA